MDALQKAAADLRTNPGLVVEVRDGVDRVGYLLGEAAYSALMGRSPYAPVFRAPPPKAQKPRPAGKSSYRQRHKRSRSVRSG